jgi:hypothetical protein
MPQYPSSNNKGEVGTLRDDRRRAPRVQLSSRLHGTLSPDLPLRVVEMSLGGMAIESSVPFSVGALHVFTLTLGDGSTVEIAGRVMHSRPVDSASSSPVFATGVQFVEGDGDSTAGDLLDRVR